MSEALDQYSLFKAGEVVEIVQISRRQLQYWSQTDLIRPSVSTPGGHSRYTFHDLVALKAAKRLIDAGVSVQRIRKSIRALRQTLPTVERPLTELILVATGDVLLAFGWTVYYAFAMRRIQSPRMRRMRRWLNSWAA